MCRAILQTQEPVDATLIEAEATMSFAEEQENTENLLKSLVEFLDEVNANATEENIYTYWNSFWIDISQDNIPSGYFLAN